MAPRGRYERGLNPGQRCAVHRAALIRATAEAMADQGQSPLSVERVARHAERGRNTFYAHFRGMEQATRAVESTAAGLIAARLELSMRSADTPREKLRAVIGAWLGSLDADPVLFRALLAASERATLLAWEQLAHVLGEARDSALITMPLDQVRMTAAVGAFLSLVRAHAHGHFDRSLVGRTLEDLLLRIFR